MFIVNITYTKGIEVVEKYLEAHIEYLKEQYKQNNFIASGRKNPRVGGIILSNLSDKNKLNDILEQDPFKQAKIANYDVIEFIPSMVADGYENLQHQN